MSHFFSGFVLTFLPSSQTSPKRHVSLLPSLGLAGPSTFPGQAVAGPARGAGIGPGGDRVPKVQVVGGLGSTKELLPFLPFFWPQVIYGPFFGWVSSCFLMSFTWIWYGWVCSYGFCLYFAEFGGWNGWNTSIDRTSSEQHLAFSGSNQDHGWGLEKSQR